MNTNRVAPSTTGTHRLAATLILAVAVLVTAGCGTSLSLGGDPGKQATNADIQLVSGTAQSNGQSGDGGTPAQSSSGPSAPARWVQLSSKQSPLGTIVTDVNGHTLYRFDEDKPKPPTSNCSGPCATTWPPVTINPGGKVFLDGTDGKAVGTVQRPDGSTQVTLGGWPVYRFSGDQNPGDTNGQGVKGTWFAVAPTGMKASTVSRAPGAGGASSTAGSGSTTSASSADGTSSSNGQSSADNSGQNASLTLSKGKNGTVVTDGSGRTVYVNSKDSRSKSHCESSGDCGGYTPVKASQGMHSNISGIKDSDLGSIRGANGVQQMALDGHPLYTYNRDHGRGDQNGDGNDGQWYALGLDDDK